MDGNQALAYTRIRQDGNGDFGRTQRQRVVLQAIFKEAKSMSYSEVMDLANQILPNVATDLSNEEIISYLTSILTLGTTEIDQKRIPIDDSFTQDRINNMAVLIPDMDVNTNALQEFIYEYDGK
jgi:anionic cell wall polymer biosynthesis LytR-Cps2A-Psr (LCP) family protein